MAGALETIPLVGLFFLFSNTCAGALWAVHMERSMIKGAQGSFRYAGAQKARRFLTGSKAFKK